LCCDLFPCGRKEVYIVLIIIGALVVLAVVLIFNGLVALKMRARNAWADIDVQLKRRHDLVSSLVVTVKGYAEFEKLVLENVTAKRSAAVAARRVGDASVTEQGLQSSLKTLFAVAENYPDLKANRNFLELQTTLVNIEDTIQHARRYYNAVVRDLNTRIETFPFNIVAGIFRFRPREFFQLAGPEEAGNVSVEF